MPRLGSFCVLGAALIGAVTAGCSAELAPFATETSEPRASYPMPPPSSSSRKERDAPAEPSPPPVPVELDVEGSIELLDLGDAHAAKGNVFLAVTIVVENGLDEPLPVSSAELSLRTRRQDVVFPSAASSALLDPCDETVPPSSSLRCTIAFEVPQNDAADIVLTLPSSDTLAKRVVPPTVCNIVRRRGKPVEVRVSTDPPPAFERSDVPDGTFLLIGAELYTERERDPFPLPASTVEIRDGLFQEVSFGDVITRTLGEIESRAGGIAKLSCQSPAVAGEPPLDTVSYDKEAGLLVLERRWDDGTPNAVLRRIFREE